MKRKTQPLLLLAAVIAVAIGAWLERSDGSPRPNPVEEPATKKWARLERLVPERAERAQLVATLELIERGGPFPFKQDNTTFGNREGRLPSKPRGHYREYTVPTPGASNRGARRVVRGKTGETFYTRDHYRTFMRIDDETTGR
jgi:ribonuclease T1